MSLPRYAGYRDTGEAWLGQVPDHWVVCALAYRYEVALGKMLDEKRISGNHLAPYLRNVDVQWGAINITDLPQMDFAGDDLIRYCLKPGDLLVCEGGEVGRAAIWSGELPECYYQKALHRLRPKDNNKDATTFAFYQLYAASKLGLFVSSEGRSTIAHLTAEALRRYRFAYPPLAEQLAITAFLDRETGKIDALVEEQKRLIELLKEKRQAVISHAVTKGLKLDAPMNDSGVEWLGEIPVHWEKRPLKYAVTLESGGTPSKANPDYWGGTIPWASAKDLKSDRLSSTKDFITQAAIAEGAASTVSPGSVLVLVRGMMLARTFPVSVAVVPMAINQDLKAIKGVGVESDFLAWLLRGLEAETLSRLDEAGHGTKALRMEAWTSMAIPIPPVDEQREIANFLEIETKRIDELIATVASGIELLSERRMAIISAAVTGKIDVRSIADVETEAA